MTTSLMAGKKGLIMGTANERSIAWAIAKTAIKHGAEAAFTYQGDVQLKRVGPLVASVGSDILLPCDVTDTASIDAVFDVLKLKWKKLDFVVHAIAYSDKQELKGNYIETSRDNFLRTMEISCYSFTEICRKAAPLMTDGGSLLTLSYHGAQQVMPNYNVMGVAKAALEASVRYLSVDLGKTGIRVNALSAGPMKTLAAAGISNARFMRSWSELNAPLRRNITSDDVGNTALYLISDLSPSVTGGTHYVDAGYHVVGLGAPDKAREIAQLLNDFTF